MDLKKEKEKMEKKEKQSEPNKCKKNQNFQKLQGKKLKAWDPKKICQRY